MLPAILKLMPFAKSSYAFSKSKKAKEGPALEIRLAKVVDTAATLKKLSARVTKATGIKNLLTKKSSTAETGGVLIQAAVDDYDTWTQALAIVLDDEAVEWVDLQQVVTTGSLQALKTPALEQRMLRQRFIEEREMKMEHTSRRLDDYAQDLVGVNIMQKHNITGSSIIVGITDTGLYIDHDQFDQESRNMYDDEDLTARKVIYYQTFANNVDEAEGVTCGHGTRVGHPGRQLVQQEEQRSGHRVQRAHCVHGHWQAGVDVRGHKRMRCVAGDARRGHEPHESAGDYRRQDLLLLVGHGSQRLQYADATGGRVHLRQPGHSHRRGSGKQRREW